MQVSINLTDDQITIIADKIIERVNASKEGIKIRKEPNFDARPVPIAFVAKQLKISRDSVREGIKSGLFKFGSVVEREGNDKYHIYAKKLYEETGVIYEDAIIREEWDVY